MTDRITISEGGPRPFFPAALSGTHRQLIRSVIDATASEELDVRIDALRHKAREFANDVREADAAEKLRVAVAFSLLADLVSQGWVIGTTHHHITVQAASFEPAEGETIDHAKSRIREGLQVASNQQLAEPSVQEFLRLMERERDFNGRSVSIASLIDSGPDLLKQLEQVRLSSDEEKLPLVRNTIRPMLEECAPDARCTETGLKLQDIWRYFRYTWSLEYNSLPGRTQRFLIRNAARPYRPVIGIAMLASPTANLGSRDEWVGWHIDQLSTRLLEGSVDARFVAQKLVGVLRKSISDIRSDDLVSPEELIAPNVHTLLRLEQIAAQGAARRRADLGHEVRGAIDIRGVDKSLLSDDDWLRLSDTGLFKKKRSEQLVPLLRALATFQNLGVDREPATALYTALTDKGGRTAVRAALNEIKKQHLASEVADLAVCGAIAPYNKMLGGKLVALVMASKEAREFYRARYEGQVSEIASQIAGRAVVKSADLKLLTTTSLYGVGNNQYTRLSLKRATHPKLASDVVWKKLRSGRGVSITHITDETVGLMRSLGVAVHGRRRINSVFGEGSSPRMRQVREGLNLIGINDDGLLKQSHGRKVYGCELYDGAREDVLGFSKRTSRKASSSIRAISESWLARWLLPRLQKQSLSQELPFSGPSEVLDSLKSRAFQGALLRRRPSGIGEEARDSVSSISSANASKESGPSDERIAPRTASSV